METAGTLVNWRLLPRMATGKPNEAGVLIGKYRNGLRLGQVHYLTFRSLGHLLASLLQQVYHLRPPCRNEGRRCYPSEHWVQRPPKSSIPPLASIEW
jgi:hypothetical protein